MVSIDKARERRLRGHGFLTTAGLAIERALVDAAGVLLLVLFLILGLVLAGWDPQAALTVHGRILSSEIVTLGIALDVVPSSLAQRAGTRRQLAGDGGVGGDPIGQGVLAVLDDSLGGFVTVIGGTGLAWSDRSLVHEFQQVFTESGNDGELLAVLTQGIKLIRVCCLELLTRNVGQLSFSDQRFRLSTDEFLLENDNLGRVGLLEFEVGNLVGDLLLAWEC